jgi:hypothetical protein
MLEIPYLLIRGISCGVCVQAPIIELRAHVLYVNGVMHHSQNAPGIQVERGKQQNQSCHALPTTSRICHVTLYHDNERRHEPFLLNLATELHPKVVRVSCLIQSHIWTISAR